MRCRQPQRIVVKVAWDSELGEFYCIDEHWRGIYLIAARTAKGLLKKLRPIVRAEYADDPNAHVELRVLTDTGPRWPSAVVT